MVALVAALACFSAPCLAAGDTLPSWRDGTARQAVVGFVDKVTRQGGPDYVPPNRAHSGV